MDFNKLLLELKNNKIDYINFNRIWYNFITLLFNETVFSKSKQKIIKRVLDVSIQVWEKQENKNMIFLEELKNILDYEHTNNNRLNLINDGTIYLMLNTFLKVNKPQDLLYIYNMLKLHKPITQRVNFKIIDILDKISSYNEIYFHSFNAILDINNNLYNVTSDEINRLICIYYNHNKVCTIPINMNINNLLKLCVTKFWYVKIDLKLARILKGVILDNKSTYCVNCRNMVEVNKIPLNVKNKIRDELMKKCASKKVIKFINNLNLPTESNETIYIFDGGNIGYYKEEQKELDVDRINIAVNYSRWKNEKKYLILNKKHSKLLDNISSDNLNIIFTKDFDDDILSIYLWLSFSNTYLISNDKFRKYLEFGNNKYFKNCLIEMIKYQKVSFNINKKTFIFNSRNNILLNWLYYKKSIHFPVFDKNNINSSLYCCYKVDNNFY